MISYLVCRFIDSNVGFIEVTEDISGMFASLEIGELLVFLYFVKETDFLQELLL